MRRSRGLSAPCLRASPIVYHGCSIVNEFSTEFSTKYDKFHIANCLLCKNYVDGCTATEKICRLYKYLLKIKRNEEFDTSRAKECRCYTFNQEEYERVIQEGVNALFDEI